MRILVRLAFILSILSMPLSGCMETGAQREVNRIQTQNAAAGADGEACLQAAFDKSQYTGIVKKGGFNFSTFSLQMLNDPSFPTKDEIKSLYAIYADIQDCRQLVLGGSGKAHQMYMLAFVESFSNSDRLWAEFTKGKMPWGKFNEGRKTLREEGQRKIAQVDTQLGGQLQNQHQFELQQRQRAAECILAMGGSTAGASRTTAGNCSC